jgi:hypothetical protein
MDRYSHWANAYSELVAQGKERKSDGYHYTDEALNTFPRYQVLNAILIDIERLRPEQFKSVKEAEELIGLAGRTAESLFTKSPHSEIQMKAMAEEREAFCDYLSGVSEDTLENVPPLFYRRVLSQDESSAIWAEVKSRWGIKDKWYWYPLIEGAREDVIAVQDKYFHEEVGIKNLREILSRHDARVWELREGKGEPEYEMELSIFDPAYNGLEGYWSSEGMDWLIYASHESSITFGGKWLIGEIKRVWPNWMKRIWESPCFE